MVASDIINFTFPHLKPSDSIQKAIDLMEDNHVSQLVLCENNNYLGIISEQNIDHILDYDSILVDIMPNYPYIFANENEHILETLSTVQANDLQVIAVLDEEKKYIGSILTNELLQQFSKQLGNQEIGAISFTCSFGW